MPTVVPDGCPGHDGRKDEVSPSLIDEIVREGARRMLAEALRAEVDAYIAALLASSARTVGVWWSVTAAARAGRC